MTTTIRTERHGKYIIRIITFNQDSSKNELVKLEKGQFITYMKPHCDESVKVLHGAKQPDECYVCEKTKTIVIIEKKFQQTSGSACEKLQTGPAKLENYAERYPGWTIKYVYVLSNWFKQECEAELKLLDKKGIPYYFAESTTYINDIVQFILSH